MKAIQNQSVTNTVQDDEVLNALIGAPTSNRDSYIEEMLTLDKSIYDQIMADSAKREVYGSSTVDEKTAHYNPEFVDEINKIYDGFVAQANNMHNLATSIYKLSELTGATYDSISKTLSKSLKKELGRSYICKLYNAGKALSSNSGLTIVKDVEKLAIIGKLPEDDIKNIPIGDKVVVANQNVNQVTRQKFTNAMKDEYPSSFSSRQTKKTATVVQLPVPTTFTLEEIKAQLEQFLPSVVATNTDVHDILVSCIDLIDKK